MIILALAAVLSQIVFREIGPIRVVRERAIGEEWAPIKSWYAYVCLPLYQFLIGRWLWRWLIWCHLLWRLSRLRIKPVATHPDHRGGLGFLSEPTTGFAWVVLATSVVQAGVWANKVVFANAHVMSFREELIIMLAGNLLLALAPLMFFCGHLWRCRFQAIRRYDELATDYTRQFQRRWIERHERTDLLGTADIQSLADLANSYGIVEKMRMIPVTVIVLVAVAAATVGPVVPVILLEIPVMELLRKVGSVALGGLPG